MKAPLLVIDNYDSFVYNLVQYLCELGHDPLVARNDAVSLDQVGTMTLMGIVISPGPCSPTEAGISTEVVRKLGGRVPILGVCLGHQCRRSLWWPRGQSSEGDPRQVIAHSS